MRSLYCLATCAGMLLCAAAPVVAGDWPQWRHDAARSRVTRDPLPADMRLQWTRELPTPRPAWPRTQWELHFDFSYEPVVMGKSIFAPSMVSDSVTAYDTDTGVEKWRFYADGPVRFAPVAGEGKLWFASDDGRLYCLNAETGALLWKIRGGPDDRTIIGNGRLIGMWPIRGAPVLYDGKIYFAAGIWPFMGIFVRAVDAQTGKEVWSNSGTGAMFIRQPHGSPAFAGVAPQGYIAAEDKMLIVPGGRTAPAGFDRRSGELVYFHLLRGLAAGYALSIDGSQFDLRGHIHSVKSGYCSSSMRTESYLISGVLYRLDHKGGIEATDRWRRKRLWQEKLDAVPKRIFIKAGHRLYCSGDNGLIMAIDLGRNTARVSWRAKVKGTPFNMLAADGKLFVVTEQGDLLCFAANKARPRIYSRKTYQARMVGDGWAARAEAFLKTAGVRGGYCISLGIGRSRLIQELLNRSDLRIIAIDPDPKKVDAFRRSMDALGLYGRRVAARVGDPFDFPFPPYLASLIVSEDLAAAGFDPNASRAPRIFAPLRPYGGAAFLRATGDRAAAVLKWAKGANLENARLSRSAGFVVIERPGALPGSADWTHQNADAANTLVSAESRIKAPLGLLWFGGPANDKVLPRHGHGPSPQVIDGRLLIQGPNMLRAVDVYTGRVLWEREFRDLGKFYDNTSHQAGAGEIGGNYVSMQDGIYVVRPRSCLRLDPATGKTTKEFILPTLDGQKSPRWGFAAICEDSFIATAAPLHVGYPAFPTYTVKEREQIRLATMPLTRPHGAPAKPLRAIENVKLNVDYASASRTLVVMNRSSGRVLWSREARYAFRHNAIAVGNGKVFCLDKMSRRKMAYLARRGLDFSHKPVLYALDLRSGRVIWETDKDVFGTWLAYSREHDVLAQTGAGGSKDRALDEVRRGIAVYRAADGKRLWKGDVSIGGPCMIHHDWIIHGSGAFGLLTGKTRMWTNPLTGAKAHWRVYRGYGCGTMIGSQNLLTFRSSAAGFYDLLTDSGTGNMGGFKSGCTSNLIAANGVLNAPDYTRTCICNFQNQTSLAMLHDPSAEVWTSTRQRWDGAPVRRVGINFGAPGDRMAENGTLWLDFPSVGGKSPDIPVKIEAAKTQFFRHHSLLMKGSGLRWVAASGVTGAAKVTITLSRKATAARRCTVRLVFADPDRAAKPGQRVFSVSLQGKQVLKDFDVAREARGGLRALVRAFNDVPVTGDLNVTLTSQTGASVLCGIEVIASDHSRQGGSK